MKDIFFFRKIDDAKKKEQSKQDDCTQSYSSDQLK